MLNRHGHVNKIVYGYRLPVVQRCKEPSLCRNPVLPLILPYRLLAFERCSGPFWRWGLLHLAGRWRTWAIFVRSSWPAASGSARKPMRIWWRCASSCRARPAARWGLPWACCGLALGGGHGLAGLHAAFRAGTGAVRHGRGGAGWADGQWHHPRLENRRGGHRGPRRMGHGAQPLPG